MPPPPLRTPQECLATLILWLSRAVDAVDSRRPGGMLAMAVVNLAIDRLRGIHQRFDRLAARIGAGTYKPRRPAAAPRKQPARRRPRRKNPLPRGFGWMLRLVPGTAVYGSQLRHLFQDPAMAALMQAAPAPIGRVLRPLCWMLRVPPPPLLAAPRRPRPIREKPPPKVKPARPEPMPHWPHDPRKRTRLGFYKGPPPLPSIAHLLGRPPRKTP